MSWLLSALIQPAIAAAVFYAIVKFAVMEKIKRTMDIAVGTRLEDHNQENRKLLEDYGNQNRTMLERVRQDSAHVLEEFRSGETRRNTEHSLYAQQRHRAYPLVLKTLRECFFSMQDWYQGTGRDPNSYPPIVKYDPTALLHTARNIELTEELYMSEAVRRQVQSARRLLADLAIEGHKKTPTPRSAVDVIDAIADALTRLRDTMIQELRSSVDAPVLTDDTPAS